MDTKGTTKTEKLVTAIYMLTNFFDEKEPMKWELRKLGNGLVSFPNDPHRVSTVLGLLSVAKNAGLITDMNFEIVHREFSRLLPQNMTLEDVFAKQKESLPEPQPRQVVEEKIE